MSIDRAEYEMRQERLREALVARNLAGAVVVSRGGFTYDRGGDVLYLTGHYQAYVYLPDQPPHWSGRAHTVFLLRADGASRLCVSTPELDRTAVVADKIAYGPDFTDEIVAGLRRLGLTDGRLGLIGADVLPARIWRRLSDALPAVDWIEADEALAAQRRVKSPAEQEMIRTVAATNRRAVSAFLETLAPGATEAQAVAAAAAVVAAEGAGLYFAAASSGEMSGAYASRPLPGFSTRVLNEGDLVRLDLGIVYDGYYSDFGRTAVVGRASPEQTRLLDTLHAALDATISAILPGVAVREVVAVGDRALAGLDVAMDGAPRPGQIAGSYPVHWGHGLGLGWERPWMVADETLEIEAGMYLAIERALSLEGVGTAAAEQNLLVGPGGVEVLTEGPEGRWS